MGPIERIHAQGQFKGDVPLSSATRIGDFVFVSGIPGFDSSGLIAVDDFAAQMRQAMENVTLVLQAVGATWDRVVKVNVLLVRSRDVADMNRIYSRYFAAGTYPARTTAIVLALPRPEFLVEIECQAMLG